VFFYFLFMFIFFSLFFGGGNRNKERYSTHTRFYLAGELAVRWTMNPEPLISAMRKAQQPKQENDLGFAQIMAFVPPGSYGSSLIRYADLQPVKSTSGEILRLFFGYPNMDLPRFPSVERRIGNLERMLHQPLEPKKEGH